MCIGLLFSCGNNDVQIAGPRITGVIDGEQWDYKSANAYIFSSDLKYQVKFLSTKESAEDPCAVPSPGNPFLSIIIPLQRGSFSLPLPNTTESARFHLSPGNTQIAVSGWLEIDDIINSRIFGRIQAQLDDENTLEGSFEVLICN